MLRLNCVGRHLVKNNWIRSSRHVLTPVHDGTLRWFRSCTLVADDVTSSISLDAIRSLGSRRDWKAIDNLISSSESFDSLLQTCIQEAKDGSHSNTFRNERVPTLSYVADALIHNKHENMISLLLHRGGQQLNLASLLGVETATKLYSFLVKNSQDQSAIVDGGFQAKNLNSSSKASFSTSLREQSSDRFDPRHVPLGEMELARHVTEWMVEYENSNQSNAVDSIYGGSSKMDPLDAAVEAEIMYKDIAATQRHMLETILQQWPVDRRDYFRLIRTQLLLTEEQYRCLNISSRFISGCISLESFRFISEAHGLDEGVSFLKQLNEAGVLQSAGISISSLNDASITALSFNRFPSQESHIERHGDTNNEDAVNPFISIGGRNEERSLAHLPQRAVHELFEMCSGETTHEVLLRRTLLRALATHGHYKAAITWLRVLTSKYKWIGLSTFHDLLDLNGLIGNFEDTALLFHEMNKEKARALSLPRKMGRIERDYELDRLTSSTVRSMVIEGRTIIPQKFKGESTKITKDINFDSMLPPIGLEFGPTVETYKIFLETVRTVLQQAIFDTNKSNQCDDLNDENIQKRKIFRYNDSNLKKEQIIEKKTKLHKDISIEKSPQYAQISSLAFELIHRLEANRYKIKPTFEMIQVLARIAYVLRHEKMMMNILKLSVQLGKLEKRQLIQTTGSGILYSWQLNTTKTTINEANTLKIQQNHILELLKTVKKNSYFEPNEATNKYNNKETSVAASMDIDENDIDELILHAHQLNHQQIIAILRIATDLGRKTNNQRILRQLVNLMEDYHIVPTRNIINSIMKGYMNTRYYDDFLLLFESLPKLGITRSITDAKMLTEVLATRNHLLDAWKAFQAVEKMIKQENLSKDSLEIQSKNEEDDDRIESSSSMARKMRIMRTKQTRYKRVLFKRLLDHFAHRGEINNIYNTSRGKLNSSTLLKDASFKNYRQRRGAYNHSTDCGKDKISDEEALQAIDTITKEMLNRFQNKPISQVPVRFRETEHLYLETLQCFFYKDASKQIIQVMLNHWSRLQHPRANDLISFIHEMLQKKKDY